MGNFNSVNNTLTTPNIGTPSAGNLANCSGLPDGGLSLTDVTTNNASTSKHGFVPKLPNDATKYYDGTGNYSTPSSAIPSGAIIPFAMNTAPSNWLECNGSAISRVTYAALFAAIGTTFGNGDGSTTFNIPDLRGDFIRGWSNGSSIDSGRVFGSTQEDAFQGHYHSAYNKGGADLGSGSFIQGAVNNASYNNLSTVVTSPTTDGTNGTPRTASETRPINVALMYCIKI